LQNEWIVGRSERQCRLSVVRVCGSSQHNARGHQIAARNQILSALEKHNNFSLIDLALRGML
jgi:hypothetical protein